MHKLDEKNKDDHYGDTSRIGFFQKTADIFNRYSAWRNSDTSLEEVSKKPAEEQTLIWLLYLQTYLEANQLETFFEFADHRYFDFVYHALGEANMTEQQSAFMEYRTVRAGPSALKNDARPQNNTALMDPTDVIDHLTKGADAKRSTFNRIQEKFGTLAQFQDLVSAYIVNTPALAQMRNAMESGVSEESRFDWFLWELYLMNRNNKDASAQNLSPHCAAIYNLYCFSMDTQNEDISQYLMSENGKNAPNVVSILRHYGGNDDADKLAKAIAFFGADYPASHLQRINYLDAHQDAWEEVSRDADPTLMETRQVMMQIAKEQGYLP